MTVPIASKLMAETLEARFGMLGRYWSPVIAKAYLNVLIGYEYEHAKAVIGELLQREDVPPTDAVLDRLLSLRQGNDAATYRPDYTTGYELQRSGISGPSIAKKAFSEAWRRDHPNGEEEPKEWLNMLSRMEAYRKQRGLDKLPTYEDDPYADPPERVAQPVSRPQPARANGHAVSQPPADPMESWQASFEATA